jgi:hypothetical protein
VVAFGGHRVDPEVPTPFNFLCSGIVVGSAGRVIQPILPGDTVSIWHMEFILHLPLEFWYVT